MERKQKKLIVDDLEKKMVFLSGPRQVGKTFLAKEIMPLYSHPLYLNYDELEDRKAIKSHDWSNKTDLIILDELHKMPKWKNYLKGLYDTKPNNLKILVTGSARLETFTKSGDSLAGRYFKHRLNPISIAEIENPSQADLERLLQRGGFPEPFLSTSEVDADRWRLQYIDGLIREDILDFEKIHDFKAISLVLELLRRKVTSTTSYTSIAEDVSCSPNTVKKYIQILEALHIVFRITPYSRNIARSLLKEPKLYFYDTGLVKGDDGQRFENLIAISVLKHLQFIEDTQGKRTQLYYLRTKDKKEVDLCLCIDELPIQLIEVKLRDKSLSKNLLDFSNRYNIPAIQVVKELRNETKLLKQGFQFLSQLAI